jgi:hypothetical protein
MARTPRRAGIPAIPAIQDPDVYATFQALREVLVRFENILAPLASETSWSRYVPKITSEDGGTVGQFTVHGRYMKVNKTVFFHVDWQLGTVGTASDIAIISLPGGVSREHYAVPVVEVSSGGAAPYFAYIDAGYNHIHLDKHTSGNPFVSGHRYILTGFYEEA